MRRVTGLALLLVFLAAPTFAATSRYGGDPSPIQTILHRLVKALEDVRILIPGG